MMYKIDTFVFIEGKDRQAALFKAVLAGHRVNVG